MLKIKILGGGGGGGGGLRILQEWTFLDGLCTSCLGGSIEVLILY